MGMKMETDLLEKKQSLAVELKKKQWKTQKIIVTVFTISS